MFIKLFLVWRLLADPHVLISRFTIPVSIFGRHNVGKTWPTHINTWRHLCYPTYMPLQSLCVCVCDCNAVVTQQQGLRGRPERAHYTPALFTLTLTNCGGEYTHTHGYASSHSLLLQAMSIFIHFLEVCSHWACPLLENQHHIEFFLEYFNHQWLCFKFFQLVYNYFV